MADALLVFFSSLRWRDILDIAINSYILFRLYVLFRGTATFRVLVGLAGLWFVQRLSLSIGLIVTSWAIQGITAAAAIIIIVIFRNEIRTVFQTKNLKGILWGLGTKSPGPTLDALTAAVFELSEGRVGALLVLPGKDDLEAHVRNCIPWRGLLSKEMIKSIFWPGNPVHDGAAIVEGDRVSKVACILPLSKRTDLPRSFGTRHRAAVGLCEVTDALVIVVSEETGRIGAALGSEFRYFRQPAEFADFLKQHHGKRAGNEERERRKERWELTFAATLSFLLISSVWFGFTRSLDTLVSFEVPVQYGGRRQGLDIVASSDDTVKVQLIGAGALIKSIRPDQVAVNIDLGNAVPGKNTIRIAPADVTLPPGIAVNRVVPGTVEVVLDRYETQPMPVQVQWSDQLPENLLMPEVQVDPGVIRVTGRSLVLREVTALYTVPVSLAGMDADGTKQVPVIFPEKIKPAAGQRERVTVRYTIRPRDG